MLIKEKIKTTYSKIYYKLEILVFLVFIILFFFKKHELIHVNNLENDRLVSLFSIVSGIYVTALTLMGTTIISVTKSLLLNNLDKKIMRTIVIGILETLTCIVLLIFKNTIIDNCILTMTIVLTGASFVRFIIVLIMMFKANMKAMKDEIDEKEKEMNEILCHLYSIDQNLEIIKKQNKSKK